MSRTSSSIVQDTLDLSSNVALSTLLLLLSDEMCNVGTMLLINVIFHLGVSILLQFFETSIEYVPFP